MQTALTSQEILDRLIHEHAMPRTEVYLHPLLPAIEMAWLEPRPNAQALQTLWLAGQFIRKHLAELTGGIAALSETQLVRFLLRHLPPAQPRELSTMANLSLDYLRAHSSPELVEARLRGIWLLCYRVACSNSVGRPNLRQWWRLQEIAPQGYGLHDLETLSHTHSDQLIAELRRQQPGMKIP